jgi:hypothetical protein
MKKLLLKLILILLFLLISSSCIRTTRAEGTEKPQIFLQDTPKYVTELDTLMLAQRDSVKHSKKSLIVTKLDTVSVLPEIRKNMEVMKYQQKQLDSLLAKRKK